MRDINFLKNNNIDVDGSLEFLGDMEMYDETLEEFLDGSEDRISKLEQYCQEGDMKNYEIEVHALKSDSKYLGFSLLAEMALEQQEKASENDADFIKSHYSELMEELKRVIGVSNKYLEK